MEIEKSVCILVQKFQPFLLKMDITQETPEYATAVKIKNGIESRGITVIMKDLENRLSDSEISSLKKLPVLLVITSSSEQLNIAQKVVDKYEQISNSQKKIIYAFLENTADIQLGNIVLQTTSPNSTRETFGINGLSSIDRIVDSAIVFLNNALGFNQNFFYVDNVLKQFRSTPDAFGEVVEREWIQNKLCLRINSKPKRIIWLRGEHGSGKSHFVGLFYANLDKVLGKGIYYCKCTSRETQNTQRIIKALAYALNYNNCIPGYANAIFPIVSNENFSSMEPEELFTSLLVNPFRDYPEMNKKEGRFVFIIDGIDELKTNQNNTLTSFLTVLKNHSENLPGFLTIIFTSPMLNEIEDTVNQLSKKYILDLDDNRFLENKSDDARRYLERELNNLGVTYSKSDIDIILEKAHYNFDYLHYFIDQCEDLDGELPDLDALPRGLESMFIDDFKNRFSPEVYHSSIKPILEIIALAYEPISSNDLAEILQMSPNDLQRILKGQLRQFLKFTNESKQSETVTLYNRFLQLWLMRMHEYGISEKTGNMTLCNWIISKGGNYEGNSYLQKYALIHLLENQNYEEIQNIIVKSTTDVFERLKEKLADVLIQYYSYSLNLGERLLSVYRTYYTSSVRIRDLLVYSYRYVVRRKGNQIEVLSTITDILKINNEEVRANLLVGESISDYEQAKTYFSKSIQLAKDIASQNTSNPWWSARMLGVAYNRLANLEIKNGNVDAAEEMYLEGKNCFINAEELFTSETPDLSAPFVNDYSIILRDQAINCERLGDIHFKKRTFTYANDYYTQYYKSCLKAYKESPSITTKWDLSISLLRQGDSFRYLGKLNDAKDTYRQAYDYRRDIFLDLRDELPETLNNFPCFKDFACPNEWNETNMIDDIPRESRDIEPIRDLSMCCLRLGDLAFLVGNKGVAKHYYDYYFKLCSVNDNEVDNPETAKDFLRAKERLERLS